MSGVGDMTNMFLDAGLSNHNYDALLIGWSAIDADESGLRANVSFHAGDARYCVGTSARAILTDTHKLEYHRRHASGKLLGQCQSNRLINSPGILKRNLSRRHLDLHSHRWQ